MAKKKPAAPSPAKTEDGPKGDRAKFWHDELKAAEKREDTWRKRGRKVVDRYRDEREKDEGGERRTNILWSNTETLKAILFQSAGKPDVRRRFPKKGKDEKAARTAALVLERGLSYCADEYDVDSQIQAAVEDHLLPGRGQVWTVYDAEVREEPSKDDADELEPVEIGEQSVRIEHIYWEDYRTSAGRKESDIWWKARRHQYTRDELTTYFPEHAKHIPLEAQVLDGPGQTRNREEEETFKRANVWEIWDKKKRERVYVAEDYPVVLKKDQDPYRLKDFFPCPPALYGCKTTSSLVPIPEFTLYQDQCEELDAITTRLNRLIDALKRRGVYDAALEGADNQLSQLANAGDNEFLPYRGMAALMEKGGLKNVFQSEDLAPIIAVVQGLYQQRALLIQTIYEVTGISDVVRGQSNPNETATAQRIKGQFGSLRVTTRQQRVAKFIRDAYRLKAEIIAEHFTKEKLEEMTGIDLPYQAEIDQAKQQLQMAAAQQQAQQQQPPQQAPPGVEVAPGGPPPLPPMPPELSQQLQATVKAVSWEDVSGILRSDARRGYKVDVETDDTAQMDEQAEKESRIEFLNNMQPVMQNALLMTQQAPELLPLAKETMLFTVRAFKVGRSLEEAFEDAFDELANRPPAQAKPDPEEIKAQIAAKQAEQQMQINQQKAQSDLAIAQANIEGKKLELQGKQMEVQAKAYQMDLDFMSGKLDLQNQVRETERAEESHAVNMQGVKAKQDQAAEAAAAKAASSQQNTVESPSNGQPAAPSRPPMQAPTSQLQQVLAQMVMGFDELRKTNELLVRAVTAPKTTKLVRDAAGRSVAAVQQTLGFEMPAMAN